MLRALASRLLAPLRLVPFRRLATATLLLIGLSLWGPLLARNVMGTSRTQPAHSLSEPVAATVTATPPAALVAAEANPAAKTPVMPVPPPVDVLPPVVVDADAPEAVDAIAPESPTLESTIVGVRHRAAMIGGQLYLEGAEVHLGGKAFVLTEIEQSRVVLRSADAQRELTITTIR